MVKRSWQGFVVVAVLVAVGGALWLSQAARAQPAASEQLSLLEQPLTGQPPAPGLQPPMPGQPFPLGQPPMPGGPLPPMMMPMFGPPVAICATADYVYVVRGNTLYQFEAKELRLLKKVTLEEERPFPGSRPGFGRPGEPLKR